MGTGGSTAAPPEAERLSQAYALLEIDAIPGHEFPWDPALGDAFNSREHELKQRCGAVAAGWLSAGRPRREAFRVGLRLVARDSALRLHDACLDLAAALAGSGEADKAIALLRGAAERSPRSLALQLALAGVVGE